MKKYKTFCYGYHRQSDADLYQKLCPHNPILHTSSLNFNLETKSGFANTRISALKDLKEVIKKSQHCLFHVLLDVPQRWIQKKFVLCFRQIDD